MSSFLTPFLLIALAIVAVVLLGVVVLKLYNTTTKERAFVRTGTGSQKVVLNGGAFVVPGIHQIVHVAMNTLRLEVEKKDKESLITADRLRVDVKAEFYVRVKADEESVAKAAQTLGSLTMEPQQLKHQVEAKFVDALRAVAVNMSMYELNANRADFVAKVRRVVAEDIAHNGLELESVSLTSLNQTRKEFFDPNNALDAEGLLVLTRETEQRRKQVNDIEQETAVAIERKNLEATMQQQDLRRQTEQVKLATERDIANLTNEQKAAIAKTEAETRREAEQAAIAANQKIETTRIEAERAMRESKVTADAAVTMRNQEQNILVANKSKDEAAAKAEADAARAIAVAAEESVETARVLEVARRSKEAAIVKAEEKAREDSIGVVVAAEAEKEAAGSRAEATRSIAEGERDAAVLRAEATRAEGDAQADALSKKNTASNLLNAEQIALQVRLAVLQALPAIVAQSVKPLENIDSIRIAEVGGLAAASNGGSGSLAATAAGCSQASLSDQVVNGALRYRANAPLVDNLMKEVGLNGAGNMSALLTGVAAMGVESTVPAPAPAPEAPAAPTEN